MSSSKSGHRAKTRTKTRQSHLQTTATRGTQLLMTPARRRPSSEARLFELSSSSASFSSADSISHANESIIHSASRQHTLGGGGPVCTPNARNHKLARKFRSTQAINNVASATISVASSERRQRQVYKQAAASPTSWTRPPPTANKSADKRRRHLWPHQLVDDDNDNGGGGGASTSGSHKQLARLVSSASRNIDDPTEERQSVSSFSPSESHSSSLSISSASEQFVAENHHSSQSHGKPNSNTEFHPHYRHSLAGSTPPPPPPPANGSPISSSPSMFHNHRHHLHRAGQYSSSQAHLQSLVTSDTTTAAVISNNNTNSMKRTTTTPTCNSTNSASAVASRHHTRANSTQRRAMAAANSGGSSQTTASCLASQAQNNSTKPMTSSMLNNSGQPASPMFGPPRLTLAQANATARLHPPASGSYQASHFASSQLPPPYSLAVAATSGEPQQAASAPAAQSIFTFLNTGQQQHQQASQQSHQQAASTTISYANNDQVPPQQQQQQPSVISNGVAIHNRPPQQQQFLMTGGHQPANFFGQTQAANANYMLTSTAAAAAATSKSKSCLACADISIKWYIVVIALLGLICALIGTIVGAVHSAGRDYISLSLLLIGVGLVLVAISWIALRITINTYKSVSSTSSLRARSPLVSPGSARRAAGCHAGLGSLGRPPPPGANRQPTQFGRPAPPLSAGRHAHHAHHHQQLLASQHQQQALMHERLYMMAAAAAAAAAASATSTSTVASSQRTTGGLLASIKQRVPRCLVRLISPGATDTRCPAADSGDCPTQAPPNQMADFLQRCHQSGHPLPAHLLFAPNGAPPQMHLLAAAIAAANAAGGLPGNHAHAHHHHLAAHSLHPHDPLFRPPPPSYNAAMQDQRLRMIMQERASLQQQLHQAQAQQQQQSVTDTPTQAPPPAASSSGTGQSPAPRPDTGLVSADSSSPQSAQTTTNAPLPKDRVDCQPLDARPQEPLATSQHAVTSENDIYVPSRTSPTVVNIGGVQEEHRSEARSGTSDSGANTQAEVKILGCL